MGLSERIPLQRAGFDVTADGTQRGVLDYASQPPIGCQYQGPAGGDVTLPDGTTTTVDFAATAGNVIYDPYKLIDTTNNRVKVPFPGVWDIHCECYGVWASNGSPTEVQVTQGLVAVNAQYPMYWREWVTVGGGAFHANIGTFPLYVDRGWIANKTYLYVRALNSDIISNLSGSAKITSFSLWLRSAYLPGKY